MKNQIDQKNQSLENLKDNSQFKTAKVLIVIPAYNEADNIRKTVEEVQSLNINLSVLIVNDCSKDKTKEVANSLGVNVVSLPYNLGIGGAVQTGFKFAYEKNFDLVIQVDGDGQHDVSFINDLLKPILNNKADITIGSRFIPPFVSYRSSFVRRIGINFFARLISLITDIQTTDPTSGFRAFNKKFIEVFSKYYPSDFPEPEAIVVARRKGARILEVPVKMRKRAHGNSSIRYLKTLYYMIKVTFAILLDKLKKKDKAL